VSESAWRAPVVPRLDRDEGHGRSARRFRVRRVVLLAFDKRLDVRRRDQANFMPGVTDSPPPAMGASAGLHGDDAAWLLGKKAEDFLTRKLLSKATLPSARAPCA
jgi:hypothetical protein